MTGRKVRTETAEREAAEWHGRLGEQSVSTQTIHDFYAWKKTPENAEAYRRVETVWAKAGGLRVDPDVRAATAAALSRRPRRFGALIGLGVVATISAVLVAGVLLRLNAGSVYETAVGEERVVQLADGSAVRLDTATRLRVRFTSDRRGIELERGQALFTVEKDAGRPFVVAAGSAEVVARGTVFGVRREPRAVRVTLVEGAVDVAEANRPAVRLSAGDGIDVVAGQAVRRRADVAAETGWSEGRIVLKDVSLPVAVDEVNRYLTRKIEVAPGAARGDTVNGVFRTGDREAFVAAATGAFGLKASRREDGTIVLAPPTE